MPKFTNEEIQLCKLIAEKERKEIGFGDWFYDEGFIRKIGIHVHAMILEEEMSDKIPLWTLADAIEWLRERGYIRAIIEIDWKKKATIARFYGGKKIVSAQIEKTPLEACLKAVLAILEEKKNQKNI